MAMINLSNTSRTRVSCDEIEGFFSINNDHLFIITFQIFIFFTVFILIY